MHKQTQMTNRTSVLCGNRNGHHNTELRMQRHIIGQLNKLKIRATRTQTKNTGADKELAVPTHRVSERIHMAPYGLLLQ